MYDVIFVATIIGFFACASRTSGAIESSGPTPSSSSWISSSRATMTASTGAGQPLPVERAA